MAEDFSPTKKPHDDLYGSFVWLEGSERVGCDLRLDLQYPECLGIRTKCSQSTPHQHPDFGLA